MDPAISAGTGGGGSSTYPDSVDSSPRSRGGDSWDEPPYSSASPKLRLMCSYGGRIVPRPTDKSLCYLGGDTRIVVVDRNSSLSDISSRLSRTLLGGRPFSLKYQLPNEDLDSLISVTTDDDLDNMIEEYDRISANPTANNTMGPTTTTKRLRLFLFPSKAESAPSSIGSLLDDSKSETWFVDALNGAIIDSASVNCLLGLEDVGPGGAHHHPDPDQQRHQVAIPRLDSSGKLARQDVPDSPMMETTTSSIDSTSSAPALSNLPAPRVPDHFNLAMAADEAQKDSALLPQPVSLPNSAASTPKDNQRPGVFGVDEDKPDARRPPLSAASPVQKPPEGLISDRPIYYQSPAVAVGNPIVDPTREIPVQDPAYRRMQLVAESGYATISAQEQMHQFHQQQQQQQLQFIHTNAHYVQVPYYQVPHPVHQAQQFDQPAYYLPVRQNPQPPPVTGVPLSKLPPNTEIKTTIYRTMAPQAQVVHVGAGTAADQGQLYNVMGYHVMHHHHPSQAAPVVSYGYEYANAVAAASATEPVHQQMYYTQATPPPAMQAQYQTVVSEEAKQNRGS
ncbi:putative leucine-rich repeat extensin-like protein 2 [Iris pallida]|uniref:Leucine-rich repeat extensin-like protein 2 n=1 Tax=Iris pallida TaxID=29817 RepID=A0AAX6G9K6_IRIPA|nr:putative leucine-rich repeat extensin-like protein 2 [Iris pallida]